jgi:uncharacterized membrane protein YfcA
MIARLACVSSACHSGPITDKPSVMPTIITDPIFYLAATPAVILMGLAKGGFSGLGLVAIPLLALVVSPVKAAALMLPILCIQDAVSVWAYRDTFDKRNLFIMLPGALIGIALGWLLAAKVSDEVVKIGVGLISIGFVVLYWRKRSETGDPIPGSVPAGLFWGGLSGFTSFIAHAGGPPFQVHVMPQRLQPQTYVGTSTWFFWAMNLVKLVPYFLLGQFSTENLGTSFALFPLALASTVAGVWLVRRIAAERFYTLIYLLTFAVGLKILWDGLIPLL